MKEAGGRREDASFRHPPFYKGRKTHASLCIKGMRRRERMHLFLSPSSLLPPPSLHWEDGEREEEEEGGPLSCLLPPDLIVFLKGTLKHKGWRPPWEGFRVFPGFDFFKLFVLNFF